MGKPKPGITMQSTGLGLKFRRQRKLSLKQLEILGVKGWGRLQMLNGVACLFNSFQYSLIHRRILSHQLAAAQRFHQRPLQVGNNFTQFSNFFVFLHDF
jgi:hypothetical protein